MDVLSAVLLALLVVVFVLGLAVGRYLLGYGRHAGQQDMPLREVTVTKDPAKVLKAASSKALAVSAHTTTESGMDTPNPNQFRRTASVELGDEIYRTGSALSIYYDELENRPFINRLLSMPLMPGAPSRTLEAQHVYPDIRVSMDEIDLSEQIGKGGFGAVYKGTWRGAPVAVKYAICNTEDAESLDQSIREAVLSKKMSHPNVVQTYAWTVLDGPEAAGASGNADDDLTLVKRALSKTHKPNGMGGAVTLNGELGYDERSCSVSVKRRRSFRIEAGTVAADYAIAAFEPGTASPGSLSAGTVQGRQYSPSRPPLMGQRFGSGQLKSAVSSAGTISVNADASTLGTGSAAEHAEGLQSTSASNTLETSTGDDATVALLQQSVLQLEHEGMLASEDAGAGPGSHHSAALAQQASCLRSLPSDGPLPISDVASMSSFSVVSGGLLPLSNETSLASASQLSNEPSRQLSNQVSTGLEVSSSGAKLGSLSGLRRISTATSTSGADALQASKHGPSRLGTSCDYGQLADAAPSGATGAGTGAADEDKPDGTGRAASAAAASSSAEDHHQDLPMAARTGTQAAPHPHVAGLAEHMAPPASPFAYAAAEPFVIHDDDDSAVPLAIPATPAATPERLIQRRQHLHPVDSFNNLNALGVTLLDGAEPTPPAHRRPVALAVLVPQRNAAAYQKIAFPQQDSHVHSPQAAAPASSSSSVEDVCTVSTPEAAALGRLATEPSPLPDSSSASPKGRAKRRIRYSDGWTGEDADNPDVAAGAARRRMSESASQAGTHDCAAKALRPQGSAHGGEQGPADCVPDVDAENLDETEMLVASGRACSARSEGCSECSEPTPAGRPSCDRVRRLRDINLDILASEHELECQTGGNSYTSFNSEEGFGSPMARRNRSRASVFEMDHDGNLEGARAVMVVVMEYCDLGSLMRAVTKKAFKPHGKWSYHTTYRALLRTAQEIAKGMEYIHSFGIVHGDLKPANVLLKTHRIDRRGYIAKVSDFGLSRPVQSSEAENQSGAAIGTISYTAPEAFQSERVQKPTDVYAFGILLWEMFYCKSAYEGLLEGQICLGVSDGTLRPEFDESCPLPYQRMAQECWQQEPEARPTYKDIVQKLAEIEDEFRRECHRQRPNIASGIASAPRSRRASGMSYPTSGSKLGKPSMGLTKFSSANLSKAVVLSSDDIQMADIAS